MPDREMTSAPLLDGLERDALTEIVNIGVSRAAVNLRKMAGEPVVLSVPSLELLPHADAAKLLHEQEGRDLVAIIEEFSGAFAGQALLIFPEASSASLIKAITGANISADNIELTEEEALAETGNVVLNGCLASMANMLERPLQMSLPQIIRGDGQLFFAGTETAKRADDDVVLVVQIQFLIRHIGVRGYIAMVMDLLSLTALKNLVAEFVHRVVGEGPDGIPL